MGNRLIAGLMAVALSGSAMGQNATVDELVGDGAFGVKWADALDVVKAEHEKMEQQPDGGALVNWTVRDSRAVFEIERGERDTIQFSFLAGGLVAITVTFPDCAEASEALASFLGPIDEIQRTAEAFAPTRVGVAMPIDLGGWTGERAMIRLTVTGNDCAMTIGPRTVRPAEGTRSQLGLE